MNKERSTRAGKSKAPAVLSEAIQEMLLNTAQYSAASPSNSIGPLILSNHGSPIAASSPNLGHMARRRRKPVTTLTLSNKADGSINEDEDEKAQLVNEKAKNGSLLDQSIAKEPSNSMFMLAILCMVNLFANSAYSSIAPFYPSAALEKGVPTSVHGIVFSAYSISMAIFSPLFANLLNDYGPKRVLIIGCICEGVSMLVFGAFDFINGAASYATCSFLCRFLEGFGFGCLNSSSSKIVMMVFPEEKLARMNGILQSFTGLGMLVGPILGSLLFNLGGFQLPFYTVGVLLLILAGVNYWSIPPNLEELCGYQKLDEAPSTQRSDAEADSAPLLGDMALATTMPTDREIIEDQETDRQPPQPLIQNVDQEEGIAAEQDANQYQQSLEKPNSMEHGQQAIDRTEMLQRQARKDLLAQQFSFWRVISHFNIMTIAMCVSLSLMCLTFKEPVFALMLGAKDLNVTQIGLVFSIDTISYSLTSMGLNFVKEERNGMKYGLIQFAGLLLFAASMIMQGPALFLSDKLSILCIGVAIGGIGGAFINNNSVPAMFHTELEEYTKVSGQELSLEMKQKLQSSIASIHTGAFGVGSIVGPILSSVMIQFLTYRQAFMIIGLVVLACSVPHFISQVLHRRKPNSVYNLSLS